MSTTTLARRVAALERQQQHEQQAAMLPQESPPAAALAAAAANNSEEYLWRRAAFGLKLRTEEGLIERHGDRWVLTPAGEAWQAAGLVFWCDAVPGNNMSARPWPAPPGGLQALADLANSGFDWQGFLAASDRTTWAEWEQHWPEYLGRPAIGDGDIVPLFFAAWWGGAA